MCIPQFSAGKKVKCPQCQNIIVIPQVSPATQTSQEDEPIRLKRDTDLTLESAGPIHTVPQEWHRTGPEPIADILTEAEQFEQPTEHKPATLLNIFTFPFSLAGALHFILFWLVPGFLTFILFFPVPFIRLAYYFLSIFFYAYIYHYLSNCVIAAAMDERLAPDVSFEEFPAMRGLFFRLFMIFTAAGICFCPMTAYYLSFYFTQRWFWIFFIGVHLIPMFLLVSLMFDLFTNFNPFFIIVSISNALLVSYGYFYFFRNPILSQMNTVYWLLFVVGVFMLPMFLLAAVMFDSLVAFNPFLIIGSIASTFLPYCCLAVLFFVIGLLMYYSWRLPRIWSIISWGIDVYLMFIAAYILGRFFRRYEGRLNWEVKL